MYPSTDHCKPCTGKNKEGKVYPTVEMPDTESTQCTFLKYTE